MEHQTALAQLQTSIAKARGDEAEALALAEAARRDRDACASLHDVEHRSLLQVGDIPAVPTNKPYQYILPVGHPINTSLATPINISSPPPPPNSFCAGEGGCGASEGGIGRGGGARPQSL